MAVQADVRDHCALEAAAARAVDRFGRLDILVANAGIATLSPLHAMDHDTWQTMIDVNLTGVFNSFRAVLPHMRERRFGRIVATSSMAARGGFASAGHHTAAKWGVVGLVKTAAIENGRHGITVNAVIPTNCNTPMLHSTAMYRAFRPDIDEPTVDDVRDSMAAMGTPGVPWIEPEDDSEAVAFLVSPAARYISGEALTVSAGMSAFNVA